MGIGKKLEEIMKLRGTNANEIASKAGVPPITLYSMIKRDNTKTDLALLAKLSELLNVPLEYFADTPLLEGTNFQITLEEKMHIKKYRQLSIGDKKKIDAFIDVLLALDKEEKGKNESDLNGLS